MGGGMGARPGLDGLSGVHTHMSNTLNTPIEAFEYAYPMRITAYRLRDHSGGKGAARGCDGLVREITFEEPTEVTLLQSGASRHLTASRAANPARAVKNACSTKTREYSRPARYISSHHLA